jgi:hypothetical protein
MAVVQLLLWAIVAAIASQAVADCKVGKADIVFALDGSGSIFGTDFLSQLTFVYNITSRLPVDDGQGNRAMKLLSGVLITILAILIAFKSSLLLG